MLEADSARFQFRLKSTTTVQYQRPSVKNYTVHETLPKGVIVIKVGDLHMKVGSDTPCSVM